VVRDGVELFQAARSRVVRAKTPECDLPPSSVPDLIFMMAAGRKVSKKNSSCLLHMTCTGLPVSFESRAASTDCWVLLFPPNPPPTKGIMTRTLSAGIPRARATSSFVVKGLW